MDIVYIIYLKKILLFTISILFVLSVIPAPATFNSSTRTNKVPPFSIFFFFYV